MEKITLQADGLGLSIDMETFENVSKLEILETIRDSVLEWIEEEKEKEEKKKAPIWEELDRVSGYFIDDNSNIMEAKVAYKTSERNQNIYMDEAHAKSALALAKISQLMPYYGGKITDEEWRNDTPKYTLFRLYDEIEFDVGCNAYTPIAFHTEEQRDAFMSREENIQLLKDYFMIN